MRKAFVLLSGGMDSTTCLFKAIHDFAPPNTSVDTLIYNRLHGVTHPPDQPTTATINWVEAISVDYGQRHKKEYEQASLICAMLEIRHTVLDAQGLLSGKSVMLTDTNTSIPDIPYSQIQGVSPTYVPFRNGTLLSLITAHAQKWVNEQIKQHEGMNPTDLAGIYFGAHSEDAQNWAYPDCTPEFIGAMANAIYIGSYQAIRLYTPVQWLTKAEIVTLGTNLQVPFDMTWSCYKGGDMHCGVCPTCRARKDAFKIAGQADPTEYAHARQ